MSEFDRSEQERERARLERERRRAARRGETPPEPPAEPSREPRPTPQPPPPGVRAAPKPPVSPALNKRRIALGAAFVALLGIAWVCLALFQPLKGEGEGKVVLTIPRGASVGEIGELLADREVVGSATFFRLRARLSGRSSEFQAGHFEFARDMSYGAAIDTLAAKPNASVAKVTIPEGRSRFETAELAAAAGFTGDYMAASQSSAGFNPRRYGAPKGVSSLEGFLFPATYELPAGATAEALVKQQLRAFQNNIAGVSMRYARGKNLTLYDVLTIASLIDREVQKPAERKLVAAVIYNRLKQGIPLGIDATTRFETRNWSEPLTNSQLRSDSPYNTRTRKGLPPTPIGNPGLAAIEAAARPARVSYLYYVANPCKPGTHSFSSTYAEFQRDVERYNQAREAAGGKQPSGC